jgi:hypothetical protein
MKSSRRWLCTLPLLLLVACSCSSGGGLPDAADGTNLAACSDGACEVQVKTGDVIQHPELGPVAVTVADGKVEVGQHSDDGHGNFSDLSAGGAAGEQLVLNGQPFKVVAVRGEQGVLRVGK